MEASAIFQFRGCHGNSRSGAHPTGEREGTGLKSVAVIITRQQHLGLSPAPQEKKERKKNNNSPSVSTSQYVEKDTEG